MSETTFLTNLEGVSTQLRKLIKINHRPICAVRFLERIILFLINAVLEN